MVSASEASTSRHRHHLGGGWQPLPRQRHGDLAELKSSPRRNCRRAGAPLMLGFFHPRRTGQDRDSLGFETSQCHQAECVGRHERGGEPQRTQVWILSMRAVLFRAAPCSTCTVVYGTPRSQCRSERSIHRWSRVHASKTSLPESKEQSLAVRFRAVFRRPPGAVSRPRFVPRHAT